MLTEGAKALTLGPAALAESAGLAGSAGRFRRFLFRGCSGSGTALAAFSTAPCSCEASESQLMLLSGGVQAPWGCQVVSHAGPKSGAAQGSLQVQFEMFALKI